MPTFFLFLPLLEEEGGEFFLSSAGEELPVLFLFLPLLEEEGADFFLPLAGEELPVLFFFLLFFEEFGDFAMGLSSELSSFFD